ncbi:MAG: hypothetical protein DDT40_01869 [candidate division WS2 bacterium]|nr:hypothetical protein [Candidatus Psychracetigena formicireducens]
MESEQIRIVQEINPGINLTAVKKSVAMMREYGALVLILGGQYGVTCEEIDEKSLANFLEDMGDDITLILTDELGESLNGLINRKRIYKADLNDSVAAARQIGVKNILLIYRSHFANVEKR